MNKIAIHGLPRSGTTWIGEIINSSPQVIYRYQPLFSYAMKGYLGSSSSVDDINRFFNELAVCDDEFIGQVEARRQGRMPTFEKDEISHVAYKEVRYHHILPNMVRRAKGVRFILIQRNPFSVVNSWLRAPKEFRTDLGWVPKEEWRYAMKKNLNRPEEFNGYEKWKEVTLLFQYLSKQYPDDVMVIRYDELLHDTENRVKKMFSFLSLDYTGQTDTFIRGSAKADGDAYSVNRTNQRDDKWMDELHPDIVSAIKDDLRGSELQKFLPNN